MADVASGTGLRSAQAAEASSTARATSRATASRRSGADVALGLMPSASAVEHEQPATASAQRLAGPRTGSRLQPDYLQPPASSLQPPACQPASACRLLTRPVSAADVRAGTARADRWRWATWLFQRWARMESRICSATASASRPCSPGHAHRVAVPHGRDELALFLQDRVGAFDLHGFQAEQIVEHGLLHLRTLFGGAAASSRLRRAARRPRGGPSGPRPWRSRARRRPAD